MGIEGYYMSSGKAYYYIREVHIKIDSGEKIQTIYSDKN